MQTKNAALATLKVADLCAEPVGAAVES